MLKILFNDIIVSEMSHAHSVSSADCVSPRRVLSSSPIAQVEGCPCGVIHVNLGPFSFRVTEEALEVLSETLVRACESLALEHERHRIHAAMRGARTPEALS